MYQLQLVLGLMNETKGLKSWLNKVWSSVGPKGLLQSSSNPVQPLHFLMISNPILKRPDNNTANKQRQHAVNIQ